MTNKETAKIYLKRIGMKTFVQYYDVLKTQNPEHCRDAMNGEGYSVNAVKTKVASGIRLFREHLEEVALQCIAESERVDGVTKNSSKALLNSIKHIGMKEKRETDPRKLDDDSVEMEPGLYIGTFSDSRDMVAWDHIYMIFSPEEGKTEVEEDTLEMILFMANMFKEENPRLFNRNVSNIQQVKNGIRISGVYDPMNVTKELCRFELHKEPEAVAKVKTSRRNPYLVEMDKKKIDDWALKGVESARKRISDFQELINDEENIHRFSTSTPF